jgi:hypothetical protein
MAQLDLLINSPAINSLSQSSIEKKNSLEEQFFQLATESMVHPTLEETKQILDQLKLLFNPSVAESLWQSSLKEIKSLLDQLELLNFKPKLFIGAYFDDLIRDIDLDAETILYELETKQQNDQEDAEKKKQLVNDMRIQQINELRKQEKSYQDRLDDGDYAFNSEERKANRDRFESLKSTKVPYRLDIEEELNRLKQAYLENRCYLFLKIEKKKKRIPSLLVKFENIYFNERELECIRNLTIKRLTIENFRECDDFETSLIERICHFINDFDYDEMVGHIMFGREKKLNNRPQIQETLTKRLMKIRRAIFE